MIIKNVQIIGRYIEIKDTTVESLHIPTLFYIPTYGHGLYRDWCYYLKDRAWYTKQIENEQDTRRN